MSSITNINNNSSVINVGRTTPVAPGAQPASRSIPVVMASDQTAIPVEEQNKVQSEVALSLLGIPRAEVALGIFADVNTYDVNPSEWSMSPEYHIEGYGVQHLPTEAGALVEAPRDKVSVLTSKRFFRYQPGRVSAATFGIRSSVSVAPFARNPVIRKYGIYDKYDGYYWETKNNGVGDNFSCVRRTQSVANAPVSPYGIANTTSLRRGDTTGGDANTVTSTQLDDYRTVGLGASETEKSEGSFVTDRKVLIANRFEIVENALAHVVGTYVPPGTGVKIAGGGTANLSVDYYADLATAYNALSGISGFTAADMEKKCKRDLDYWIDFILMDLEFNSTAHVKWNTTNFALSNGSTNTPDWGATDVGRFPRIQLFEKPVHVALEAIYTAGKLFNVGTDGAGDVPNGAVIGFTTDGKTKLDALQSIIRDSFDNGSDDKAQVAGTFAIQVPSSSEYGARSGSKLDSFFDVKKNFWAYYVTTKKQNGNAITYTTLNHGTSGNSATNGGLNYLSTLTDTEIQDFIRNKCQRDVVYVIDGYKNDIIGGGDAETTYNASMFLRGTGMSVYSQEESAGVVSEIERHTHLKSIIQNDLLSYGFTASDDEYTKLTALASYIVANFNEEQERAMTIGNRGFAGNLVVLRDGLIHTHAAMNDPSLLKDSEQVKAIIEQEATLPSKIKITKGRVTFGQHIKLRWVEDSGAIVTINGVRNGEVLRVVRVLDPKATHFHAQKLDGTIVTFTDLSTFNSENGTFYVELVVPFLTPIDYDLSAYSTGVTSEIMTTSATLTNNGQKGESNQRIFKGTGGAIQISDMGAIPVGAQFPYLYDTLDDLTGDELSDDKTVGFINTAINPQQGAGVDVIRSQIDNVNFYPEYVNWVKNNVKPEYWGVYEYRVPRSRFSHDALNGVRSNAENGTRKRVYSDLATGVLGTVRPGEKFINGEGVTENQDSLYDFDFTKVTMLKIEFSWYGAVGALFLAYVPVSNGEARWVRVHHLRASNQLKIASLGNATLPITYTTYGGGSQYCGGDGEDVAGVGIADQGYGSNSHNIVKYGASYYIDGGDRGTVRLYSYNNPDSVSARGKKYAQSNSQVNNNLNGIATPSVETDSHIDGNSSLAEHDPVFFMGASVITNSKLDNNVKVIWADATRVYFNRELQGSSIKLLPDRANTIYGLETKRVILSTRESNAVRNRVQVYPTKLSTSNSSADAANSNSVRLRFKKTPLFQSLVSPTNDFKLDSASEYTIDSTNTPLPVSTGGSNGDSRSYMQNGEFLYGWFRARVSSDNITVFGRLYKEGDQYYFELLQSVEGTVILTTTEPFLPDGRYAYDGENMNYSATKETAEIEGLSSLKIATDVVVPIPNTGTNVATLYLQTGTEQFDLDAYFDYNKEYLSFPLTDIADSLYFCVDSDTSHVQTENSDDAISLGVTWEEQ